MRPGEDSALASAQTSGSTLGVQPGTAGPITAEPGTGYVLSEQAAGSTDLARYTATYECRWSGAGTPLFSRGSLAVGENGLISVMLPAIPEGKEGQTLGCEIINRVKSGGGLTCTPDSVYALRQSTAWNGTAWAPTEDASIRRFTAAGAASGTATADLLLLPNTKRKAVNALAINRDGSEAIVAEYDTVNAPRALTLHRWVTTNTPQLRSTTYSGTVVLPRYIVAGAIDPTTGDYYFGGYSASGSGATFDLFVVRATSTTTYTSLGKVSIPGSTTAAGNGDIAFDAGGNLYFLWSVSENHRLTRLSTADLDVLSPTSPKTSTLLSASTNAGTYNGITFDGDGNLWVSTDTIVRRISPTTGADIGAPIGRQQGLVDMASCGLPPTMVAQKNLLGRAVNTDQFTFGIYAEGRTEPVQSSATTGNSSGVQPQLAGPMVVTVGEQYTLKERSTRSGGLDDYMTSYACRWSDESVPFASGVLSGTTTERSAKLPPIPASKPGQQLACTLTNEPIAPATLIVKKTVLDAAGGNPSPGSGWNITATRPGGTVGTSISTPASQTTGASGSVNTPWEIKFPNSSASATITIAETMRAGYQFSGGTCTITPRGGDALVIPLTSTSVTLQNVGTTNRAIHAGDQVECEFINQRIPGSAAWGKVDGNTPAARLQGSTWALSGPSVPTGTVVSDCVAATSAACPPGAFSDRDNRPGFFKIEGLDHGQFILTEATAPSGYIRDPSPKGFTISPEAANYVFAQPFVNRIHTMPALPLTGGMSGDSFLIFGGGLIASAMVGAWFYRRRNPRLT